MNTSLPVFELTIGDEMDTPSEVNFVSLVNRPAIQRDFLTFSERILFTVADEEQHIVSGPAMIPNSLIYRRDRNGEYYVTFTAKTIDKIVQRFFLKGYQGNINIMHKAGSHVLDSVFYESWIVDRNKGKQPLIGFEDLPDGTWFLTAKINNPVIWNGIKTGEYKGFSVEGLFDYKPISTIFSEQDVLKSIVEILKSIE